MFKKLQRKWKVNDRAFLFIIISFAAGGSLCGYAGRKLLSSTSISSEITWIACYILIVTVLWPLCVLLVSFPLGQSTFFRQYLTTIFERIAGKKQKVCLAIFASGAGSNAARIIEHFKGHTTIAVALIVCNKPGAGVLQVAQENGLPVLMIEREIFFNNTIIYTQELERRGITWVILAGFLWKVPDALIRAFPDKIINIHPALLPKYGGKGMYGQRVHEAVIADGEAESGISIHLVDEEYDHGKIIMQARCAILPQDDAVSLAKKVLELEHKHFAGTIEATVLQTLNRR